MLKAYLTYIRPKLESSSQAFNSISQADSKKLESCQRYFTRMLFLKCGLGKRSYEDRLKFLKIPSLKERRFLLDLSLCHKIFHSDIYCPQLLVKKQQTRNLQHNYRLVQEITGGKQRYFAFANRVVSSWNTLSDAVINMTHSRFCDEIGL